MEEGCVCPLVWGIHRQYNSIIDVSAQTCRPAGWGLTPRTTEGKKNTNMFPWCSQQGIRRLLLTGLKQYIPFLCPSTPQVLLRNGVFLSFPFRSFSLQSLSYSYYWMFNLVFGSFLSYSGIMSVLSNPEIPHQCYVPELLSFRNKWMLAKRWGDFHSLFSLKKSEQMESGQRAFQSMCSAQTEYVIDRFYLSEAAEFI